MKLGFRMCGAVFKMNLDTGHREGDFSGNSSVSQRHMRSVHEGTWTIVGAGRTATSERNAT